MHYFDVYALLREKKETVHSATQAFYLCLTMSAFPPLAQARPPSLSLRRLGLPEP